MQLKDFKPTWLRFKYEVIDKGMHRKEIAYAIAIVLIIVQVAIVYFVEPVK